MASGDALDFIARLRAKLPRGWFPSSPAPASYGDSLGDQSGNALTDESGQVLTDASTPPETETSPVLGGLLAAFADMGAFAYAAIFYVKAQARIATASGAWLDGKAFDYLGGSFLRLPGEQDAQFSLRARREIVRARATRPGVVQAVEDVTGTSVQIFEPFNIQDTGAWDAPTTFAWNAVGFWGSRQTPNQFFLKIPRPVETPGSTNGAWNSPASGWGLPTTFAWGTSVKTGVVVIDDDLIYRTVLANIPVGVTAWVYLGGTPDGGIGLFDNFFLDYSELA